jgi:hypothetical protein
MNAIGDPAQPDAGPPPNLAQVLLADDVEAAAFREVYAAAPAPLARSLGLRVEDVGGATALLAANIPDTMFNRVIGLGFAHPVDGDLLDAVASLYRGAGCAAHWVHASSAAWPAGLAPHLEARGYSLARRRAWAKMLRGNEPAPAVDTALRVRPATARELPEVARTVCDAFGMPAAFGPWMESIGRLPNWRVSVALDADEIVGAGYLYLDPARGAAWLGLGGLRSDRRRRGAHRALMAQRIAQAIAAGCADIVTETGEPIADEANPSLRNMHWCGFTRVCSRLNYEWPARPAPRPGA